MICICWSSQEWSEGQKCQNIQLIIMPDVWKYLEREIFVNCEASIFIRQDFPLKKLQLLPDLMQELSWNRVRINLMQSRYWLWSVPAVLLRRNCTFGFNATLVHQLWTKQREEGSFSLRLNNARCFSWPRKDTLFLYSPKKARIFSRKVLFC